MKHCEISAYNEEECHTTISPCLKMGKAQNTQVGTHYKHYKYKTQYL